MALVGSTVKRGVVIIGKRVLVQLQRLADKVVV